MALDLSQPKTPPPAKRPSVRQAAERVKTSARQEGVDGLFQMAAAGCLMAKQYADAQACAEYGPKIAEETAKLAEQNEGVARVLDYITQIGPYAGLLTAVLPFGLQILANHGRVPASALTALGVKDPQILELQAQREVMEAATALQREQAEFARELAEYELEQRASANGSKPADEPATV